MRQIQSAFCALVIMGLVGICCPAIAQPADATRGGATPEEKKEEMTAILSERNPTAAKAYVVDTSIPSAPAFALLGVDAPQTVGAPFGGDAYLNVGSGSGDFPEIGAAARPFWVLARESSEGMTIDDYRKSGRLTRLAGRTLVTAAVGPIGGGEAEGNGAAIGVYTSLLDKADPRMDLRFERCVLNAAEAYSRQGFELLSADDLNLWLAELPKFGLSGKEATAFVRSRFTGQPIQARAVLRRTFLARELDASIQEITDPAERARATAFLAEVKAAVATQRPGDPNAEITWYGNVLGTYDAFAVEVIKRQKDPSIAQYEACVASGRERYTLEPDLSVGVGALWRTSETGSLEGLEHGGASVWLGYRHPFVGGTDKEPELIGDATFYLRYQSFAEAALPNDLKSDGEAIVAYAGLTVERERWRFSVGASWNQKEYDNSTVEDLEFSRISTSLDLRLNKDTWLQLGYGSLSEDVPDEDDYGFARLKFAMRAD